MAAGGGPVDGLPEDGLPESVRAEIVAGYLELLERHGSPLLDSPDIVEQLVDQCRSVLDAVPTANLASPAGVFTYVPDPSSVKLSIEIGSARAAAEAQPADSLRAAVYMFEAGFPILAREFARYGVPEPAVTAGLLLNRALMDRMIVAAASYVGVLLTKVHRSHLEERYRVARELHDRAAPAVGVGMQNLELYEVYRAGDPDRAAEKLAAAREALREALGTIRSLSAESRASVGPDGLEQALARYLCNVPDSIQATISTSGDLTLLPQAHSEELFLVLREAVRNAVLHAQPRTVTVELHVTDLTLLGQVHDDGRGFSVDDVLARPSGIGLMSMRERVGLLGGALTVTSRPGSGTSVLVRVPLPGVRLD